LRRRPQDNRNATKTSAVTSNTTLLIITRFGCASASAGQREGQNMQNSTTTITRTSAPKSAIESG
jgi:hypothetical protein